MPQKHWFSVYLYSWAYIFDHDYFTEDTFANVFFPMWTIFTRFDLKKTNFLTQTKVKKAKNKLKINWNENNRNKRKS